MNNKIKLFTHTDFDGVSCAIVAFKVFGKKRVEVTYCDYHDVNEKVNSFLEGSLEEYSDVFITDISVNEEVARKLEHIHTEGLPVVLLDHHDVEWLNEYSFGYVSQKHNDGRGTSGTTMLFEYLYEEGLMDAFMYETEVAGLSEYAERVREYDTYDWKKILNDEEPNRYNNLFYFLGRDRWITKVMNCLDAHDSFFLSQDDRMILDILDEQVDAYIGEMSDNLMSFCVGKYQVGVVFGEQHISEVGNELHKMHPSLDLIAIINMKSRKVSYRTIREDIDAGKFARYFGGGGRQATAGSQLLEDQIINIVRTILPQ